MHLKFIVDSHTQTLSDPGIYWGGGGQTKFSNPKLRAKPGSRERSARESRAKPESKAQSARELRANPEKKRGKGSPSPENNLARVKDCVILHKVNFWGPTHGEGDI